MWKFLVYVFIFKTVYSGCPHLSKEYEAAEKLSQHIGQDEATLLQQGFVLDQTDPGSLFYMAAPLSDEINTVYNKSKTLLLAQKLFHENNKHLPKSVQKAILKLPQCEKEYCFTSKAEKCDESVKYRSADGSCNNLINSKWGAKFAPYTRFAKASYNDDIHTLRKSMIDNEELPNIREIGNSMQTSPFTGKPAAIANFGALSIGEFLAVDVGNRQIQQNSAGGPGIKCCAAGYKMLPKDDIMFSGCAPYEISEKDPILSQYNMTCGHFVRTQPIVSTDCSLDASQPANIVSHFLDLQNLYGNSLEIMNGLRSKTGGKLLLDEKRILPKTPGCEPSPQNFGCYTAGDARALAFPTMALIYSTFVRLHNQIAEDLSALNGESDDEKLFYETRRIVQALYQHLIYNEWLPLFVGKDYVERQKKHCGDSLFCGKYKCWVNPSTLSEFSHAALPQFHVNIPTAINFYDESEYCDRLGFLWPKEYEKTKSFSVNELLMGPVILETNYADVFRGILKTPVNFDKYSDELRNRLLNMGNPDQLGIDLLSDDINRGRDHGHSPYYVYKNLCTPRQLIDSWESLESVMTKENIEKLKKLYASVFDVDLFVGIILEERSNEYLGPVGKCIMQEQFDRYKLGDRFFYSHEEGVYPFTPEQMKEIKQYTFAKHYCNNVQVPEMPARALEVPNDTDNKLENCSKFGKLNLSAWKNVK